MEKEWKEDTSIEDHDIFDHRGVIFDTEGNDYGSVV